ncbi:MAG: hypothetical protein H6Q52_1498 [Deltaproteobacteria bacterium]|nr:hypothetical protein [Deltaproteobacteria bacterium]
MKYLSSYVKARIRDHIHRTVLICIGFVIVAGTVDGIQSHNKGKKILRGYDESLAVKNDGRDSGHIYVESDAATGHGEKGRMVREVSAYNSIPDQTDSTPCISADGTDICKRHNKGECIVASNVYPLNTRLRIETIGDCTVADRMSSRFGHRVDLFMDKDIRGARNFGVQRLTIAELEDADM